MENTKENFKEELNQLLEKYNYADGLRVSLAVCFSNSAEEDTEIEVVQFVSGAGCNHLFNLFETSKQMLSIIDYDNPDCIKRKHDIIIGDIDEFGSN